MIVKRMPDERTAITHRFKIITATPEGETVEYKGFITVGFYEDGAVGEIFMKLHNQGSDVSGFCDAWAISVSMLLQRGVPLSEIVQKFRGMRFEPSGATRTAGIRRALSPLDYAARYLERRFIDKLPLADESETEEG